MLSNMYNSCYLCSLICNSFTCYSSNYSFVVAFLFIYFVLMMKMRGKFCFDCLTEWNTNFRCMNVICSLTSCCYDAQKCICTIIIAFSWATEHLTVFHCLLKHYFYIILPTNFSLSLFFLQNCFCIISPLKCCTFLSEFFPCHIH
jgi:hypothetical protein